MHEDLISKFPNVLKNALKEQLVNLPSDVKTKYCPVIAYRGVSLNLISDDGSFDPEAFYSQIELKNKYPNKRNLKDLSEKEVSNYSCSLFWDIQKLNIYMRMPRKNKATIRGKVICEKGAAAFNQENTHINWWLYDGANETVGKNFEVINNEKK